MAGQGGVRRREFLTGMLQRRNVALAASGGLAWVHLLEQSESHAYSIRPPGAQAEPDFLATCIKCGQCVEACPFDTLHVGTVDGDTGIGVPYIRPRETPCYMCPETPCIAACPTDALVKGTRIEDAKMGLAVLVDRETCLAFRGLRCEVCYRACPLMGRAIGLEFRPQERTGKHAFFLPVVNSEHCTGCGMCEHACVLEESAIRVLPRELAKGKLGDTYRFGWLEEAEISQEVDAPEAAPDLPEWKDVLERVLEHMDDLGGIHEP